MKKLESYIIENREYLDSRLPEKGHLSRFEKRVKSQKKTKMVTMPLWSLAAAAAIAILIAAGIGFGQGASSSQENSTGIAAQDIYQQNPELAEVEMYYSSMVSQKLHELEAEDLDQYQFAFQLKKDLKQIEASNEEFRKTILEEGPNEFVLNAMIDNYKLKLSILKKLSKLIKKSKQKNQAPQGV